MSSRSTRLQDHFSDLTDPRRRKVVYPLINLVTIAVCAVIAGADDFVSIAAWGRQKRDWLSTILDLSSGIPSHDRFNAVFAALDPAEFEKCLLSWITALHEITAGQVVAIDGKTLRGSFDKASGKSAIHMVSAWATANHISLGQVVVDAKSNEITAIPKLLELLEISGSIVTIDAMGCQTAIAEAIIARSGLRAGGEGQSADFACGDRSAFSRSHGRQFRASEDEPSRDQGTRPRPRSSIGRTTCATLPPICPTGSVGKD